MPAAGRLSAAIVLPRPIGCGVEIANDFPEHRVWWTQMDAYFVSRGYLPLWNPFFEMGAPHLASAFGTGTLYPPRWCAFIPTCFGGYGAYVAHYVLVAPHMGRALAGAFILMRRHAPVRPSPSCRAPRGWEAPPPRGPEASLSSA